MPLQLYNHQVTPPRSLEDSNKKTFSRASHHVGRCAKLASVAFGCRGISVYFDDVPHLTHSLAIDPSLAALSLAPPSFSSAPEENIAKKSPRRNAGFPRAALDSTACPDDVEGASSSSRTLSATAPPPTCKSLFTEPVGCLSPSVSRA
mmetsp:Transcript_52407/g.86942  ORF Transcript_52407/g.86942 Transcript_52407/m.86942 type:complete len:148 (-) Transcript_52407:311-754(-)